MRHIARVLEELRRYIATRSDRADLEEIDTLLGVALAQIRRKLAQRPESKAG
jgi:hypothetical protein